MNAGFHSPIDEAKAEVERCTAAYKKIDDEYMEYKRTHALPLDDLDPTVISLRKRRDSALDLQEAAFKKLRELS